MNNRIIATTLVAITASAIAEMPSFSELDANGDGQISQQEFRKAAKAKKNQSAQSAASEKQAPAPHSPEYTQPGGFTPKFVLRKSVFSQNSGRLGDEIPSDAAQISWSRTGGGSENYAVDTGIAYRFAQFDDNAGLLWIGADYHRNSALAALTDYTKAGLSLDWKWKTGTQRWTSGEDYPVGFGFSLDGFYKNDTIADRRTVSGSLGIVPMFRFLGCYDNCVGDCFSIALQPFASISGESTTDTGAGIESGSVAYAKYGVKLSGFVAPNKLGRAVEFDATYTRWDAFDRSGSFNSFGGGAANFTAGLTLNLSNILALDRESGSKKPRGEGTPLLAGVESGIRLQYESGDNPENGTVDTDLLTLTFTAKY